MAAALLLCLPWTLHAAASGGIDAVVVLDSSGSMKKTDPLSLRLPAAKLFISLLGADDRVGVIGFSDLAKPLSHLTAVSDDRARASLFAAVDKVSSTGAWTNLYDALAQAQVMLTRDVRPATERYIILMSDGKMDVGDAERDRILNGRMIDDLVPALKEQNIHVFTIAFTTASDIELLKAVAQRTGGLSQVAQLDKDLHGVFTTLFEDSKAPDMLPMDGNAFTVDDSVEEVTVVASKESGKVRISLQSPDGKTYTAADKAEDMRWFSSERFDMITLPKPAPGAWNLVFSEGRNKAYIVTDLGIVTDVEDQALAADSKLALHAWLRRGDEIVTRPEILSSTRFDVEIEQPDGTKTDFTLFDNGELGDDKAGDGVYSHEVELYKAGPHQLRIVAKSETFEREIKRFVLVQEAAETPAEPAPVEVTPPTVETTPPAAEASSPPASEPAAAEPAPEAPATPAPPAKKKLSIWAVLWFFLVVNLLIGGIIWLVIFLKRRKAAQAPPAEPEKEDEPLR
jgi:hypothetical protein